MLRKSPMNYLATLGLAGLLWIATGLLLGNYLGENASLQVMTTEQFLVAYRIGTAVAALFGVAICSYWYFSGAQPTAAADPRGARKRWVGLMICQVLVAVGVLVGLVVATLAEALTSSDYVIILVSLLLGTMVLFWTSTLTMSPRAVMAVVPGKR